MRAGRVRHRLHAKNASQGLTARQISHGLHSDRNGYLCGGRVTPEPLPDNVITDKDGVIFTDAYGRPFTGGPY